MKTGQPMVPIMPPALPRKIAAGLALAGGLVFSTFAALGPADAQPAPLCTQFGPGVAGQDGWMACPGAPNIVITTSNIGSIGGPTDWHLHLRDTAGASAACSTNRKYLGNWVEKMGGCGQFCFDFKVFVSGFPPGPIRPSFSIYSGALRMVFVANFTVTSNDPWRQRICAPIKLLQPGEALPASSSGAWQAAAPATAADWNTVIQNVTMIQFPVDFTASPSEEVGYDNLCMTPEPCGPPPSEVTGCLKDMKVEVKCNPDGTYTVTLSGAGFTGTDITLTSLTPGVTVVPPQQPWSATTTWTLVGATPGQTVTLTANSTQIGGGTAPGTDLCCSGEIKITMPECRKPIDLAIVKENTIAGGSGTQFNLTVGNVGAPITFSAGQITVTDAIPAGMTVTSVTGTNWTCGPPPPPALVGPATLTCTYNLAGSLGQPQVIPDSIYVNYTTTGPGPFTNCATVSVPPSVGVDTNPANDKSCVTVTETGCPPPSVPGPIPGSCTCVPVPGALCACPPPLVPSPVAGLCVPPPPSTIDLSIEKTGGTSPAPQVNAYAFHLAVKNMGAAFSGANVITVTDVVPAGMTFNTATGPNWTCATLPASAGSTITCTYTGTGPTAPGQSLGTIDIFATALGAAPFPPFTNCATVGLTPASGLVDVNPPNNTSCVTVRKPVIAGVCDPRTTIKRGAECACRYPGMVRSSEAACMCAPGANFIPGRGCVRTPECRLPQVLNAARTACGCPAGTVPKGRECVRRVECRPPSFSNPAGTACLCPTGFVMQGRECVRVIPRGITIPRGIFGSPSRPGESPRGR